MKHVAGVALALAIASAPSVVHAQEPWPTRSITFLVPYGAGGYTDLVGRLTARYIEKALGKPVVVENRAGAGGIVGTQFVANAAPDGYTFCVCSVGAISVAPKRSATIRCGIWCPSASSARSCRPSSSRRPYR
jgi:tripartite-type tricarboxylate transporter receptor subunit TctC